MNSATQEWDYVVVGAGSAGAVMASRLVSQSNQRVLLLEAGGDQSSVEGSANPLRETSRLILDGYNWDYQANLRDSSRLDRILDGSADSTEDDKGTARRSRALWNQFPYRLGKVVGGSSAVNGTVAMRALPEDFEDWVRHGNSEWSWDDVLPFYNKLECDADFASAQHGDNGPIPITRPGWDELNQLEVGFWNKGNKQGLMDLPDLNGGEAAGVGPVPGNAVNGKRVDTATAYVDTVRGSSNFSLYTGTQVNRILFDGRRATGVEILRDNRLVTISGRNIILCAGAVGTPAILMRSGVGNGKLLARLGISPVLDLPGVGENLVDHPSVVIWSIPKPGVCAPGLPWRQVAARMASGYDQKVDVQIGLLNNVESTAIPGFTNRMESPVAVGLSTMLMRPASRGRVFIEGSDPGSPPVIELCLGSAEEDVQRLMRGVRKAWELLRSEDIAELLEATQFWSDSIMDNDNVLRSAVFNTMNPGWHAAGSTRMGPTEDPGSVVDQKCRVHGLTNIRVADASVMPDIPSAPTNLTTIMLAERIASDAKES